MIDPRHGAGFPRLATPIWRGAQRIVEPLMPYLWPYTRKGTELPRGPAVVTPNHLSFVDPVFVAIAIGRPLRYLTSEIVLGQHPRFDDLINWMGIIPLDLGRIPLRPLRTALAHLESGGTVGVFPEGRRALEWREAPAKQGAAWLAIRTGTPLVPVSIAGSFEAMGDDKKLRRRPITVTVGEPLLPHRFADRSEMTEAWIEWMDEHHKG
ncbi:MAG: 1-acyl-sn-glycerol-3-phosphate acyltransferase [Acidimicrobiia bacterium]|nr:1-acyl-sn-glycerol-3-phosphate acyltransferase [Acidimicrobiia bacterium]NNC43040.1 1-acyl-sn-glycerol-3-phosphate acyltransferase [Acidimicrobiia bacterium]NNL27803.1 1-acyl-sn-glycerol-3-phosphate acyltransferase [Acidimicrobiia bacterium]